jgi:hypothetical protein
MICLEFRGRPLAATSILRVAPCRTRCTGGGGGFLRGFLLFEGDVRSPLWGLRHKEKVGESAALGQASFEVARSPPFRVPLVQHVEPVLLGG